MNQKTVSLAGLLFLSGLALALALAYLAGGATIAGAQDSDPEEKGYMEGMGSTADGARTDGPIARNYPEGNGGLSGMRTSQDSEVNSRVEAASGSLQLVYRFSGVTDDGKKGASDRKQATSVHCTNISPSQAQIEIQVYRWNGTTVYTTTLTLDPNGTKTAGTQNTTIYFEDALIGGSPGTGTIKQGSGQILSSTPAIICTAQTLDPLNTPPLFVTSLEMYKQ